jgi:hypothetical protein
MICEINLSFFQNSLISEIYKKNKGIAQNIL